PTPPVRGAVQVAPPSVDRRSAPCDAVSPVAAHIRVTPPTRLAVSSPGALFWTRAVTTCVNTGLGASALVVRYSPPSPAAALPLTQATRTFGSPGSNTMSRMLRFPLVSGGMLPAVVTVTRVKEGLALVALVEGARP